MIKWSLLRDSVGDFYWQGVTDHCKVKLYNAGVYAFNIGRVLYTSIEVTDDWLPWDERNRLIVDFDTAVYGAPVHDAKLIAETFLTLKGLT